MDKKYFSQDEPQKVSEPAVSYQVDINATKLRIMNDIMHMDSPDKLKQLEEFVDELLITEKSPCQYTIQELQKIVTQAEKDVQDGHFYFWQDIKAEWKTEN